MGRHLNRVREYVAMAWLAGLMLTGSGSTAAAQPFRCAPTEWDEIGPFYRPNAPIRDTIGKGYVLSGTVRSAVDCKAIPHARIEVWQAGPGGSYDDAHRATLFSDQDGRYRLETDFPPPYSGRPPHIHMLVEVNGYEGRITQHYPKQGAKNATFDLVLPPDTENGRKRNPLGG